ncbi:hypothetical protein TPHA_0M01000 [Tetrapisispora phaffii CBS 4417]|uniref:IMS import disulfide relay-system CHCH-CHCH-like Cx9C domain-containing protein n=1 Tax=Tetrapisispora phaffii (strain ATCC 24235 / CBS 4417 / NBRC 1672 / NRRL Y-8282 / UCD 70-5) TaxID=1071381 RepID=G8C0F9_TETPH|nr:hypothetical protein TPHA_0M01000 [Tetrapisispora phaffii CBS 4417]CCE65674.1 hypothetical protein TPHA_0M01000 [Tetrapisispora phaffii CBS 4417]
MSSILDELVMEDVALHCPVDFIEYHKCISKKDEGEDCSILQTKLATCIKTKVPSMQKILNNCSDKMTSYQDCIMKNRESRTINENCLGILDELRECARKQVAHDPLPINEMKLRKIDNELNPK